MLFRNVCEERHVACAFDCSCYLTLMESAGTCNAAGKDFGALGHTPTKTRCVLIIDVLNTVGAELADFFTGFAVASVVTIHCH
jgi:hypothetical protein